VPGVVALKDAAGSVDGTSDVVAATAGSGLAVLSGDDPLTLPMMAVGAVGVVSVLSNVAPEKLVALVAAANGGDFATARALHYELLHVAKTLFVEVNPVPAKRALELMGASVMCVAAAAAARGRGGGLQRP
jgi:4-hydroxy-tetrahydrodipicolinate synthase